MRRIVQAAAVAFALAAPLLGPASAARAAELPILPGWWRWDSSLALLGTSSELRCIRPADIAKVLSGGINRHYACSYSTADIARGRARLVGVCVDRKGREVPISFRGAYSPTRFTLHGTITPALGPLSLPLSGRLRAQRLSATCPAGPARVKLTDAEAAQSDAGSSRADDDGR